MRIAVLGGLIAACWIEGGEAFSRVWAWPFAGAKSRRVSRYGIAPNFEEKPRDGRNSMEMLAVVYRD
jgi:hypothetical protein